MQDPNLASDLEVDHQFCSQRCQLQLAFGVWDEAKECQSRNESIEIRLCVLEFADSLGHGVTDDLLIKCLDRSWNMHSQMEGKEEFYLLLANLSELFWYFGLSLVHYTLIWFKWLMIMSWNQRWLNSIDLSIVLGQTKIESHICRQFGICKQFSSNKIQLPGHTLEGILCPRLLGSSCHCGTSCPPGILPKLKQCHISLSTISFSICGHLSPPNYFLATTLTFWPAIFMPQ